MQDLATAILPLNAKIFGATLNCATTSKLNTVTTVTRLLRIFTMDDLHKMADELVELSMTYDLPTSLSSDISRLVSELYFSADDQRRIDYGDFIITQKKSRKIRHRRQRIC